MPAETRDPLVVRAVQRAVATATARTMGPRRQPDDRRPLPHHRRSTGRRRRRCRWRGRVRASSARRPPRDGPRSATRSSRRWPVDARPEPRLLRAPRRRRRPRTASAWSSAGRQAWQVDAGDGLRAPGLRRLRRGRGLRPRAAGSLECGGMPWVQRLLPDARDAVPGDSPGCRTGVRRTARPRSTSSSTTSTRGAPSRARLPGRSSCCRATTAGRPGSSRSGRGSRRPQVHWPWDGGWTDAHERGAARSGGTWRVPAPRERHRPTRPSTPSRSSRRAGRRRADDPSDAAPAGRCAGVADAACRGACRCQCASWPAGSRGRTARARRSWRRGVRRRGRRSGGSSTLHGLAAHLARSLPSSALADRRPCRRRSTGSPGRTELNRGGSAGCTTSWPRSSRRPPRPASRSCRSRAPS